MVLLLRSSEWWNERIDRIQLPCEEGCVQYRYPAACEGAVGDIRACDLYRIYNCSVLVQRLHAEHLYAADPILYGVQFSARARTFVPDIRGCCVLPRPDTDRQYCAAGGRVDDTDHVEYLGYTGGSSAACEDLQAESDVLYRRWIPKCTP